MNRFERARYRTCSAMLVRHIRGSEVLGEWMLRVCAACVLGYQA